MHIYLKKCYIPFKLNNALQTKTWLFDVTGGVLYESISLFVSCETKISCNQFVSFFFLLVLSARPKRMVRKIDLFQNQRQVRLLTKNKTNEFFLLLECVTSLHPSVVCSCCSATLILPQRSWRTWPFQSSCSFRSPLTPTTAHISFSSQAAVSTQMRTWISSVTMFHLGSLTKTLLGRSLCFCDAGTELRYGRFQFFFSSFQRTWPAEAQRNWEPSSRSDTLSSVRPTV